MCASTSRARGTGRGELAGDGRRAAGDRELLRAPEAAPGEHRYERVGVAGDVRRIGGEVRDREERGEIADDRGFVALAVGARGVASGDDRARLCAEDGSVGGSDEQRGDDGLHFLAGSAGEG
jgi:hypothetical protein